jgi:hypothetical protein
VVYFTNQQIGWYLGAWWIGVGLFIVLIALLVANRDQLERRG